MDLRASVAPRPGSFVRFLLRVAKVLSDSAPSGRSNDRAFPARVSSAEDSSIAGFDLFAPFGL